MFDPSNSSSNQQSILLLEEILIVEIDSSAKLTRLGLFKVIDSFKLKFCLKHNILLNFGAFVSLNIWTNINYLQNILRH